jgi:hypothetical protein
MVWYGFLSSSSSSSRAHTLLSAITALSGVYQLNDDDGEMVSNNQKCGMMV